MVDLSIVTLNYQRVPTMTGTCRTQFFLVIFRGWHWVYHITLASPICSLIGQICVCGCCSAVWVSPKRPISGRVKNPMGCRHSSRVDIGPLFSSENHQHKPMAHVWNISELFTNWANFRYIVFNTVCSLEPVRLLQAHHSWTLYLQENSDTTVVLC